jgi:hypothetical protein
VSIRHAENRWKSLGNRVIHYPPIHLHVYAFLQVNARLTGGVGKAKVQGSTRTPQWFFLRDNRRLRATGRRNAQAPSGVPGPIAAVARRQYVRGTETPPG